MVYKPASAVGETLAFWAPILLLGAVIGVVGLLLAMMTAQAQTPDPATQAVGELVGFACQNQTTVTWALLLLGGHFVMSVISAICKKLGLTSPDTGTFTKILVTAVRLMAADVKPPAAVIQQSADAIAQKGT